MPTSNLISSLPAELRNEIYKHIVVRKKPINPWRRENKTLTNLLLTNTTISHEASSQLYGNNCFDLIPLNKELVPEFLGAIGMVNASHLQHIRICFPGLRYFENEVSLEETSLHTLEKIQANCTNLKTITTNLSSTNFMESQLDSFDSPAVCDWVLTLVAAHFGAIESLQEVVLELFEDDPNLYTRRKMRSLGWKLKIMSPMDDEWDHYTSWDEPEDDYYFHDEDYLYGEDYLYDNDYFYDDDSDFWRRAAD